MKKSLIVIKLILIFGVFPVLAQNLETQFKTPPSEFKPMPFWHINGEMTTEGIRNQMKDAKELANFSGVTILPLSARKDNLHPGTLPKFLSEDYFALYQDILETAKEFDMKVIMYDDNDFPSGMAGGKIEELFPEHTLKRLDKIEKEVKGPGTYIDSIPKGTLMAAVAMNTVSLERIEINNFIKNGILKWHIPHGTWKIMLFMMVKDGSHTNYLVVDYMDSIAVKHAINLTYDKYAKRFSSYFGNVIQMTFFDDVGFWRFPRSWTAAFNKKFIELNGFDPKSYYPALWFNIGPETEAVRYAFFNTRAELLAEGYPRLVSEWNVQHGLKDTGHPPGNYDPTPIDMNGDIFKFYRYTAVPLTDAILDYQFGQNGHKLISSAAEYYDRPVVATEIYGAFKNSYFDSLMLYRPMMEMFVRGVNFVIPHGMWYNPDPKTINIPPLISPYNPKIAPALSEYSDFVGRSCLLLQGGRRVADIGLFYPFESLAGWYRFEDPKNPRQGFFVSPETDYQRISGWLTNEIRRDFTFIHPEFFLDDKYSIKDGTVNLTNKENFQEYKALILSGCNIIAPKTLEKILDFYKSGGLVISTTQLPFKSSEMGKDQQIIDLINEVFGVDPLKQSEIQEISKNSNNKGGRSFFIPHPNQTALDSILHKYLPDADVEFVANPQLTTEKGKFSYIHKIKDGRKIYYFANSSDETIETEVLLRGNLKLKKWNPHNGSITSDFKSDPVTKNGKEFTMLNLKLEAVQSVFYISEGSECTYSFSME